MKKQKPDHEKTAETLAGILVNVLLRRLGAERDATRAEKT